LVEELHLKLTVKTPRSPRRSKIETNQHALRLGGVFQASHLFRLR
jgi:hypothetical protein